ncbi:hypothetical protein OIU84_018641 [Salix udensis]|uniref:Dehydrogenase E1 component domain-containing protein n=1 Tax=Salix udensis TaxID=889485 RepID=A0AAD6PK16_9ROSI|nr:hypothetical protein OIU84_018641 [Salix udensis]
MEVCEIMGKLPVMKLKFRSYCLRRCLESFDITNGSRDLHKPRWILEMDTYRYHGHSMSDPGSTYRTRDEISGVRQERDPIERIRKLIMTHDLATEKELKDIEKEVRKQVDDAIAQAKESPMPEPSELFTNVYAKGMGVESYGADRKEVRAVLP